MANEWKLQGVSGTNYYVVLINSAGQFWNTSTPGWEAYNATHWANYAVIITEVGAGIFMGNMPGAINTGQLVNGCFYQRAGATPATTDTGVGSYLIDWSGSATNSLTAVNTNISNLPGLNATALWGANNVTWPAGSMGAFFTTVGTGTLCHLLLYDSSGIDLSGGTSTVGGKIMATPTAIQNATAHWQDTTPGDFTTPGSIGASLAGLFAALGQSVFTAAALVNAPTGGGTPQTGDAFAYLTANMGAHGGQLTAVAQNTDMQTVLNDIVEIANDTDSIISTIGAQGVGLTQVALAPAAYQTTFAGLKEYSGTESLLRLIDRIFASVVNSSSGIGTNTETYHGRDGLTAFTATFDTNDNRTVSLTP
jgi:hypothetical protein